MGKLYLPEVITLIMLNNISGITIVFADAEQNRVFMIVDKFCVVGSPHPMTITSVNIIHTRNTKMAVG